MSEALGQARLRRQNEVDAHRDVVMSGRVSATDVCNSGGLIDETLHCCGCSRLHPGCDRAIAARGSGLGRQYQRGPYSLLGERPYLPGYGDARVHALAGKTSVSPSLQTLPTRYRVARVHR